mmetsp:Transcript_11172/g.41784  ORF Transcript_11172/g.41784 Transcript_11172/m.41784 type:complete len:80 (-) Transcript_11172:1445-1684(-)
MPLILTFDLERVQIFEERNSCLDGFVVGSKFHLIVKRQIIGEQSKFIAMNDFEMGYYKISMMHNEWVILSHLDTLQCMN